MAPGAHSSKSRIVSCTVCGDQPKDGQYSTIESSSVCKECIKQLFELSIASEIAFPPRWGNIILRPEDFRFALDGAFMKRYARRRKEWSCPPIERVYCHGKNSRNEICERFLGRLTEMRARMEYVGCKKCWWLTCLRCLKCLDLGEDPEDGSEDGNVELAHVCPGRKKESNPFEGFKRGREYQLCPNQSCQRPAELAAGCNHIACLCGTNYCFICAVPAEELSDHWKVGGCPRYGQPGSTSALYNDHIRLADNEVGSDAEEEDLWRWQIETLREQEGLRLPERTETQSSHSRGDVRRDVATQSSPSGLRAPSKRSSVRHRAPQDDLEVLGNHAGVAGGRSARVPPRASAPTQSTPRQKRGLRQIIQKRRQELIDKFR